MVEAPQAALATSDDEVRALVVDLIDELALNKRHDEADPLQEGDEEGAECDGSNVEAEEVAQ